jgi:hypothetical protein
MRFIVLFLFTLFSALHAFADPVSVRYTQGTSRGFLLLRNESGQTIARGDSVQVVHGSRVTARMTFHFFDGSLDDEQTVFTQAGTFRLVSDHHIQKGPYFKEQVDLLLEANGTVTSRSVDKDGKEKVDVHHEDLPPDIANGMIGALLLNVPPTTPGFTATMLVGSGKGHIVTLHIAPDGKQAFSIAGVQHTAIVFRIKIDIHGVAGVVAPLVGKAPQDQVVWVYEDGAPLLIREVGQLTADGPTVSIEEVGTTFHQTASAIK